MLQVCDIEHFSVFRSGGETAPFWNYANSKDIFVLVDVLPVTRSLFSSMHRTGIFLLNGRVVFIPHFHIDDRFDQVMESA